jgi:hypothetical protein
MKKAGAARIGRKFQKRCVPSRTTRSGGGARARGGGSVCPGDSSCGALSVPFVPPLPPFRPPPTHTRAPSLPSNIDVHQTHIRVRSRKLWHRTRPLPAIALTVRLLCRSHRGRSRTDRCAFSTPSCFNLGSLPYRNSLDTPHSHVLHTHSTPNHARTQSHTPHHAHALTPSPGADGSLSTTARDVWCTARRRRACRRR